MGMGAGGGGGQSGGMVVGGPSPSSAMFAGVLQSQAAQAAADAAKRQTNEAINLIRQNYTSAYQSLKPYTSQGITALSELNKYMGLQQYNPGTAPVAPEIPTLESLGKRIPRSELIQAAMNYSTIGKSSGGDMFVQYTGPGVSTTSRGPGGFSNSPRFGSDNAYMNPASILNNPQAEQGLRNMLAQEQMEQAMESYNAKLNQYNNEMDLYNQAKRLYDANPAAYTAEQVQEKLMAQPGVAFQYNQGLDAIQRAASARGMLGSGRLLQSLADYGQGMASQQYGETLSRLAGLVQMGQQAATNQASGAMNLGNSTGQLTQNLGDTIANSYLARGNALSQAVLSANQEYKVIGGGGGGGGGLGGLGSLLGGAASLIGSGSGGSGLMGLFSSKTLKNKTKSVSTEEILDRVSQLNIDQWKYKGIEQEHIGPYAEEFKELFGVGDGKTINMIDLFGVLLGSIKELNNKIEAIQKEAK